MLPVRAAAASLLLLGCSGDPDPLIHAGRAQQLVIVATPARDGRALPTSQVEIRGVVAPGTVALVRGEVSDAALAALAEGRVLESVGERAVPIELRASAAGHVVAPLQPMSEGRHTLAVGSPRARHVFDVALGPPLAHVALARRDDAVVCLQAPSGPLTPLGPEATRAVEGAAGAPDDRCYTLSRPLPAALAREDGTIVALVPPSPPRAPRAASKDGCAPPRLALGGACVEVEDDRLVVLDAQTPSILWLDVGGARLRAELDELPAIVRGLAPASALHVTATWVPPEGVAASVVATVQTSPARARGVLTEALADPLGPEPDGEWVELANDGSSPLDVTGWSLRDGSGASALPSAVVAPYERVLLVTERFAPTAPAPPELCRTLPLAALGKNGLSNDGEALELVSPAGLVASRLPPAKARAGWSVSRSLDEALRDVVHAGPPTPCAP